MFRTSDTDPSEPELGRSESECDDSFSSLSPTPSLSVSDSWFPEPVTPRRWKPLWQDATKLAASLTVCSVRLIVFVLECSMLWLKRPLGFLFITCIVATVMTFCANDLTMGFASQPAVLEQAICALSPTLYLPSRCVKTTGLDVTDFESADQARERLKDIVNSAGISTRIGALMMRSEDVARDLGMEVRVSLLTSKRELEEKLVLYANGAGKLAEELLDFGHNIDAMLRDVIEIDEAAQRSLRRIRKSQKQRWKLLNNLWRVTSRLYNPAAEEETNAHELFDWVVSSMIEKIDPVAADAKRLLADMLALRGIFGDIKLIAKEERRGGTGVMPERGALATLLEWLSGEGKVVRANYEEDIELLSALGDSANTAVRVTRSSAVMLGGILEELRNVRDAHRLPGKGFPLRDYITLIKRRIARLELSRRRFEGRGYFEAALPTDESIWEEEI
ncbi:hypothetical protein FGG08_003927 [Glutinoglossum americanum]|uniref:Uncharacterized protein n=1 Tax=Glutinoglossum americanum TaxID=1670608 RepID=A0A9P8I691_9PEZI|nr:hypothetical protein FGG08_003927 [Glutinoglossum americanum]